ncbi:MAG TPA: ATP-binding protein [Candidatus Binatia bacterium]|nr:ATP-binding protein [Candidatus Binatia bacterium]
MLRGGWWELGIVLAALNVIQGGRRSGRSRRGVDIGSVLHGLPEATFLLDEEGKIVDLNPAAEGVAGETRDNLVGSNAAPLLRSANDPDGTRSSILPRVLGGESVRSEGQLPQTTGHPARQVRLSTSPVRDLSGGITGALLTVQDLTDIPAVRRQLETRERDTTLGQMTASLVHDFSNILNTISEALIVISTDPQRSSDQAALLGIINNAVHQGADALLTMRNYLAGRQEKPSRINVRGLLDEVLQFAAPALRRRPGIRLVREFGAGGEVIGNADALRRAITNLVLNALDAMNDRGTLTIRCVHDRDQIVLSLQDTGSGIPPEMQKKIFSPYFTTKAGGTGMGLAGARRAIESLGGHIGFESAPGVGTTFHVTLPAVTGERRNPTAA